MIAAGATAATSPLYLRVLGADFERLAPRVQQLHRLERAETWRGRAQVQRGASLLARALATLFALPPAGNDLPLTVTFTPAAGGEIWLRQFGRRRFRSLQADAGGGMIGERVGVVTLLLRPRVEVDGSLSLSLEGARCLGLALPRLLLPVVRTAEADVGGVYHFDVEARLPVLGLLVHYRGSLVRAD